MSIPFCIQCTLPSSHCICDQAPKIQVSPPISVLFHPRELERRNSTGRLLKNCCHISFDIWHRLKNEQLQHKYEGYSLIYPSTQSAEATAITNGPAPKGYLLLDATWQETQKMLRQSPWLNDLPKYTISNQLSRYRLRRNQKSEGLSTIECAAYWLMEQNQTKPSQELLHFFQDFQTRFLAARNAGLFK